MWRLYFIILLALGISAKGFAAEVTADDVDIHCAYGTKGAAHVLGEVYRPTIDCNNLAVVGKLKICNNREKVYFSKIYYPPLTGTFFPGDLMRKCEAEFKVYADNIKAARAQNKKLIIDEVNMTVAVEGSPAPPRQNPKPLSCIYVDTANAKKQVKKFSCCEDEIVVASVKCSDEMGTKQISAIVACTQKAGTSIEATDCYKISTSSAAPIVVDASKPSPALVGGASGSAAK
jgi:hypothetical protein